MNTSPQNGYVVRKDATAKRLTASGAEVVPTSSQEFGGFIKQETAKFAEIIKSAAITAECSWRR